MVCFCLFWGITSSKGFKDLLQVLVSSNQGSFKDFSQKTFFRSSQHHHVLEALAYLILQADSGAHLPWWKACQACAC